MREAAAAAPALSPSVLHALPPSASPAYKKLHWRTKQKLERDWLAAKIARHPVLAHTPDSHPFHGIANSEQVDRDTGRPMMHAQVGGGDTRLRPGPWGLLRVGDCLAAAPQA